MLSERDQRVASLFRKRARSVAKLIEEARDRWGYSGEEVRDSIVTLECEITPALRVRLPKAVDKAKEVE